MFGRAVLCGINISFASWQYHPITVFDQRSDFCSRQIERNANWFAARHLNCVNILLQGAPGVFQIFGMGNGNRNAREHTTIVAAAAWEWALVSKQIPA